MKGLVAAHFGASLAVEVDLKVDQQHPCRCAVVSPLLGCEVGELGRWRWERVDKAQWESVAGERCTLSRYVTTYRRWRQGGAVESTSTRRMDELHQFVTL